MFYHKKFLFAKTFKGGNILCSNHRLTTLECRIVFWPHWFIVTIFELTFFVVDINITIITLYTIYMIFAIYIICKFFGISFSCSAYYVCWGYVSECKWACKSQNIEETI